MHFKIHRGTQEIGGSCVEIWSKKTRIVVDIGMPLVEKDGSEFNFDQYKNLSIDELIKRGILPDISGFYKNSNTLINGVVISHPHIDHYGFSSFLHPETHFYLGAATHKLIDLSSLFTRLRINIKNHTYFEREQTFTIGDLKITPYWADHSAFDSYSFLIEGDGNRIFYSGDFRGHGRKSNVFKWFTHNAPQNIDYLLMEGTQIGRGTQKDKTEKEIEKELIQLFNQNKKINLVYVSGQNIDRIVSIYKACIRTGKTLIVDPYIATILKELSQYASIPYPSNSIENIKVIYSYSVSNKISSTGNEKLLYQFKHYKISKEEISKNPGNYVMIVRPSMKRDLQRIDNINDGILIYSLWKGYMNKSKTKDFIDYLKNKNFTIHNIHTSGHADIETLKTMVDSVKPKKLVPIHTFNGQEYKKYFNVPVLELKDKDIVAC